MKVFFCLFQVNVYLHAALIFFLDGFEKNEFAISRAAYHWPGGSTSHSGKNTTFIIGTIIGASP